MNNPPPSIVGQLSLDQALNEASKFGFTIPVEARHFDHTSQYAREEYWSATGWKKPTSRTLNKKLGSLYLPPGVYYDEQNDELLVRKSVHGFVVVETHWLFVRVPAEKRFVAEIPFSDQEDMGAAQSYADFEMARLRSEYSFVDSEVYIGEYKTGKIIIFAY
jgi:hypothetical protein